MGSVTEAPIVDGGWERQRHHGPRQDNVRGRCTVDDDAALDEHLGSQSKRLGGVHIADLMAVDDHDRRVIAARRHDEEPPATPLIADRPRRTGDRPEQAHLLHRQVTTPVTKTG